MTDAYVDIGEGIYALRHHWARHEITPAVIELADPKSFLRILAALGPHAMTMPHYVDREAKVWSQIEFVGVIIRAPAVAYALPGGGFEWRPA